MTPIQQKMLTILADGLPHSRSELHACLYDDQSLDGTVAVHISMLRRVLRPIGQDIVCERNGARGAYYRHVRLVASAEDGKR